MPTKVHDQDGQAELIATTMDKEYKLCIKQANRCSQWFSRLKVLKQRSKSIESYIKLNREAFMLVGRDADKENPDVLDILARLHNHEDGHPRHLVDLQRLRDIYNKRAQEALRGIKADDKQAREEDFNKEVVGATMATAAARSARTCGRTSGGTAGGSGTSLPCSRG